MKTKTKLKLKNISKTKTKTKTKKLVKTKITLYTMILQHSVHKKVSVGMRPRPLTTV